MKRIVSTSLFLTLTDDGFKGSPSLLQVTMGLGLPWVTRRHRHSQGHCQGMWSVCIKLRFCDVIVSLINITWNGIMRLTVSPTLLMIVWRRCLGIKILGRSEKSNVKIYTYMCVYMYIYRSGPLTHDLSDSDRLSQTGGGTGSSHVVGTDTELQLLSCGQVPDFYWRLVSQTFHGWNPFISWEQNTKWSFVDLFQYQYQYSSSLISSFVCCWIYFVTWQPICEPLIFSDQRSISFKATPDFLHVCYTGKVDPLLY